MKIRCQMKDLVFHRYEANVPFYADAQGMVTRVDGQPLTEEQVASLLICKGFSLVSDRKPKPPSQPAPPPKAVPAVPPSPVAPKMVRSRLNDFPRRKLNAALSMLGLEADDRARKSVLLTGLCNYVGDSKERLDEVVNLLEV